MPDSKIPEILEANAALRGEIQDLSTKVECLTESNEKLTASDESQRHGIIALSIGGGLLAVLLGIVIFALVKVDSTNDRLDRQARYDIASCERGNQTRAAQRQQWLDVRQALANMGDRETTQLANGLATRAFANFPALDCEALSRGEIPPPVVPLPLPPLADR